MFSFKLIFLLILECQAQTTSILFKKKIVFSQTWIPTYNSTEIKTFSGCSVLCLQNFDTCSAFSFENGNCSLGPASPSILMNANSDPSVTTEIWRDNSRSYIPHILLISQGSSQPVDLSLDSSLSPPINLPFIPLHIKFFFYDKTSDELYFYGEYYGVLFLLHFKFGMTSSSYTRLDLSAHANGNQIEVGNRYWLVGGTYNTGTDYFENGKYTNGPAYPTNNYTAGLNFPCLSSIDDTTGLIFFGHKGTTGYTMAWKYNFTSGNWSQLQSSPEGRLWANCERTSLTDGTPVILAMGGLLNGGVTYTSTTWMYDINANNWILTNYQMPKLLCCAATVSIDNKVYYLGGKSNNVRVNSIYVWEETIGWTLFGNLAGVSSFDNLNVLPYNVI